MKKIRTKTGEILTFYSIEEVFERASKTKGFEDAYNKELSRLRLAAEVRKARIAKKLTQKTLAEKSGMPQSVIARIESGTHGVSVDTLERIARVFGKQVKLA